MMKTLYIPNTYTLVDDASLVRLLERMARRGWYLHKMGEYLLTFEKGEPADVHYAVALFPAATEYDPFMPDEQAVYVDLCAQYGWELVLTKGPMQIFKNTQPDPTPIETDDTLKLQVIRKTIPKHHLRQMLGYMVMLLPITFASLATFLTGNLNFLTDNRLLLIEAAFVCTFFSCLGEILWFWIWYRIACSRADASRPLPSACSGIRQILVCFEIVLWVAAILMATPVSAFGAWTPVLVLLFVLLVHQLHTRLLIPYAKTHYPTAKEVRSFLSTCSIVLLVLFNLVLRYSDDFVKEKGPAYPEGIETVTVGDESVPVYTDTLPVTLEMLDRAEPDMLYSYEITVDKSVLLTRTVYEQTPLTEDPAAVALCYKTYEIPFSPLRKHIFNSFLRSGLFRRDPLKIEARWGAAEVIEWEDHKWTISYALLFDDRIIELEALPDMTDAEIELVVEQLLAT